MRSACRPPARCWPPGPGISPFPAQPPGIEPVARPAQTPGGFRAAAHCLSVQLIRRRNPGQHRAIAGLSRARVACGCSARVRVPAQDPSPGGDRWRAVWDGGYSDNPAVFPLFYDYASSDILLVLLSPLQREDTPHTVQEIDARIAELGFSAHFMREMRMFARAAEFSRPVFLSLGPPERRLQKLRFHMIDFSDLPSLMRSETKLLPHGPFLELLHGQGRARKCMVGTTRRPRWTTAHPGCEQALRLIPVKSQTSGACEPIVGFLVRQRNDRCSARVYKNSFTHDSRQQSGDGNDDKHPANTRAASRLTDS